MDFLRRRSKTFIMAASYSWRFRGGGVAPPAIVGRHVHHWEGAHMTNFIKPYELNDAELDAVAAGAPLFVGGLAHVNLSDIDVKVGDVLSGITVTVENVLNDSI